MTLTSIAAQAHSTARSIAGNEPEKPAPTVSPALTPASSKSCTHSAAILGFAVVRLASGAPMVVVRESGGDVAYALPDELAGWAAMLLAGGDVMDLLFPGYVQFQIVDGRFCADIL